MKKYLLVILLSIFAISCSKKVEINGKITGASPLERFEVIEASSLGTLPLVNLGLTKDGTIEGSFEAPNDGMYIINFAARQAYVYLEAGQKFEFTANAIDFSESLKISGDAKANNDYLKELQTYIRNYSQKLNMEAMMAKDEAGFLKEAQKIKSDLEKSLDDTKSKFKPSSGLYKFKKEEVSASILGLLSQYESAHQMMTQNPSFKVSQKFKDYEAELAKDGDKLVQNQPIYRNYMLNKLAADYQQYTKANVKEDSKQTNSEVFAKYLDTRKDLSQVTKDYLLGFVMGQFDINRQLDPKNKSALVKLATDKIKDATVKSDIVKLLDAVAGLSVGDLPKDESMVKADGKSFKISELKGKPTLVMFYTSWTPYIAESAVPIMKEVSNFYKGKMNFLFVNLDDTQEQFKKTSAALFTGIQGTQAHIEGGINSKTAAAWGIYSFKLPSFIVLDKDGKIASRPFNNLGEQELIDVLDKHTGLKAPTVAPEVTLQNDLLKQMTPSAAPAK